jgi:trigger factor
VYVYPTIDAGDYTSVRVEPVDASVSEEQVEDVIARMRKSAAEWVDVTDERKPQDGDQVTVDLAITTEDGEPFQEPLTDTQLIIGESQLFEPLRNAIQDLAVDESSEVQIAFDEEDQSATERLRGQAVTYAVTLKAIKERALPELNDEFASTVGGEETVEALRAAIRDDLHQAATNEARNEVLNGIIEKIAEGGTLDVPAPMVDDAVNEEIERLRTRLGYQRTTLEAYLRANKQSEEDLRAEVRPAVTTRLRNSLYLRDVAEREGIKVEDEEIEGEIAELVAASPNPENARKVYETDRYLRTVLGNDLFDRKLSDRLIEIATEGRDAVINPWVKPEPVEAADEDEATDADKMTAPADAIIEAKSSVVETETEATPSSETSPAGQIEGDGSHDCPSTHPIKGNASSKIYHAPGSGSYDRTIPEVCFATEEDATAAGYRASKSGGAHVGQVDGDGSRDCPDGFSIKGNASSQIYHLPGGRSYDQTIPEVCFATEEDAVAAGYRASKAGAAHAETDDDEDE